MTARIVPDATDGAEKPGRAAVTLLYHSGTGGTKLVAELLAGLLSSGYETRIVNIHAPEASAAVREPGFLVFCFPTYYLRPSPSMQEYIRSLPVFEQVRPAFIVTTYELYTENCVRRCALSLKNHGITTAGSRTFRAPGSDVCCVAPAPLIPWLFRFEKGFVRKLIRAAGEISVMAREPDPVEKIPAWKWFTPFTQALQVLALNRFDGLKKSIRILEDRCSNCGTCVSSCERGAWIREDGRFRHIAERCEFCTRCIHRCPRKAVVLFRALRDNPRLDLRLFRRLEAGARKQCGLEAPGQKSLV